MVFLWLSCNLYQLSLLSAFSYRIHAHGFNFYFYLYKAFISYCEDINLIYTHIAHSLVPARCLYHCQFLLSSLVLVIEDLSNLCNCKNLLHPQYQVNLDSHLKYWPHLARPASFFNRFSFALLEIETMQVQNKGRVRARFLHCNVRESQVRFLDGALGLWTLCSYELHPGLFSSLSQIKINLHNLTFTHIFHTLEFDL